MAKAIEPALTFTISERAAEKQRSRDDDMRAVSSGAKTRNELRNENGAFSFPHVRVDFASCRKLG